MCFVSKQLKSCHTHLWENVNSNDDNFCEKPPKGGVNERGNDILIPALKGCRRRQILINIDRKASDLQIPLRKWRRRGLTGINTHTATGDPRIRVALSVTIMDQIIGYKNRYGKKGKDYRMISTH